ncbi:anther-specific proline-rich protein APG-like [Drosophila serrata]|uniref:anther-specific proline-rich protein APG-like n=1 Tax=Drosophila serrata TaxID=7274 RepID=UPI000A1D026C|nr:anther-specific proline-rich protein APG-like [Drosophila serrata]
MKLTIGILLASILIIGLVDFSDASFLPWPPAPCEPNPPKPKPPVKPQPKPPVRPQPKPQPKPKPKPQPKPQPKPCNPPPCGPGGVPCEGCCDRDNLCKELIQMVSELDAKVKKCVCGVKFI